MYDRNKFRNWMTDISHAATYQCYDGLFYGEEGAKRFARECGAALPDFSRTEKDLQDMCSSTYSGICVIAYNLRPPIDSKEWRKGLYEGINKAMQIKPVPIPENYRPMNRGLDSSPDSYKAMWRGQGRSIE